MPKLMIEPIRLFWDITRLVFTIRWWIARDHCFTVQQQWAMRLIVKEKGQLDRTQQHPVDVVIVIIRLALCTTAAVRHMPVVPGHQTTKIVSIIADKQSYLNLSISIEDDYLIISNRAVIPLPPHLRSWAPNKTTSFRHYSSKNSPIEAHPCSI